MNTIAWEHVLRAVEHRGGRRRVKDPDGLWRLLGDIFGLVVVLAAICAVATLFEIGW